MDSLLIKKGDLITVKATKDTLLVSEGEYYFYKSDIIKHEPAPFDWKDAKQWMAFIYTKNSSFADSILYFVSNLVFDKDVAVVCECISTRKVFLNPAMLEKKYLIRAPEHDMEVSDDPAKY